MIHRMGKNVRQEDRLIHRSKKEKKKARNMPNQENERSQNEDLKTLKKEIEDDVNNRKTSHAHGPGEPILCKLLCY